MKTLYFILLLTLISCSSKKVNQEDVSSWTGQNVSTLEQHPVFSTLPREERIIPESSDKLINYSQKKVVESQPRNCFGTGIGFGAIGIGSSVCSPREVSDKSCVHQFIVNNNKVKEYRVLGKDCYTDCSFRPINNCK